MPQSGLQKKPNGRQPKYAASFPAIWFVCAGSPKARTWPYGGVIGVLQTVLQIIENENGDMFLGVGGDHMIESFRNRLWPDYKTGDGIERALLAQFHPLEEALAALPSEAHFANCVISVENSPR